MSKDKVFGPGQDVPETREIEPAPTPWLPDIEAAKKKLADRFGRTKEDGIIVTWEQQEQIKQQFRAIGDILGI